MVSRMRIAVLSGGTGTPKLIDGLRHVLSPESLAIVVNTAEDLWVSNGYISPDVDSVLYTLADWIDRERWWGIGGDTYITHDLLAHMGFDEGMNVGDRDRATHLLRAIFLRSGMRFTEATFEIARRMGVEHAVVPMTDYSVKTIVSTPQGDIHFQDFWVRQRGEPEVLDVRFEGELKPSPEAIDVIELADYVVIGPSNPITSIGPILALEGIRELLREKTVLAVSPLVGGKPVSGPAGKLMKAKGYEVSPRGLAKCYEDFLDILILDESDETTSIPGISVMETNIMIDNTETSINLAKTIISALINE